MEVNVLVHQSDRLPFRRPHSTLYPLDIQGGVFIRSVSMGLPSGNVCCVGDSSMTRKENPLVDGTLDRTSAMTV